MNEQDILEIKDLLSSPKQITLISHRNPDGDAVGASLGLGLILRKMHHGVKVVFPSEYPAMLSCVPGQDMVNIFDLQHDECREIVDKAEIIFLLDFNGLDRIDKLGENVQFSTKPKIMIDHHLDPEPVADFVLSETAASSTSELVYKFAELLGITSKIDKDVGTALFTGLITDTGSFKFGTRPYTYEVASKLKQLGVDDYSLQNQIFNSLKEKQLRLLGHCLANRFERIEGYDAGYIYLTRKDYIDFDIQRGDTEGIVNYLLMIKDINVAALISKQPTVVKISLRSKGNINVQEMAVKHFKGGGHKNASGGAVYAKLQDVVDRYKKVIVNYANKID
jgi:phosphoesterase RecJ-like protein